jgi:hypothetical protein
MGGHQHERRPHRPSSRAWRFLLNYKKKEKEEKRKKKEEKKEEQPLSFSLLLLSL